MGPATSLGLTHRLAKMLPPTLAESSALSSVVSKDFPKNSRLHQIFNENSLKVSYSCIYACRIDIAAVIRQHNKATINNVSKPPASPGCHALA